MISQIEVKTREGIPLFLIFFFYRSEILVLYCCKLVCFSSVGFNCL